MRAIGEIEQEVETRRSRQQELEARLAALEDEIEEARSDLGDAFAEGDEPEGQKFRSRVRDLEDERDGVERGLEALAERLTALEAELHEARVEDAEEERQRTLDAAEERCRGLFDDFCEVTKGTLLPQLPEVRAALAAAETADHRVQSLTGERNFNVGNRHRDTDRYWSPVLDLVEQMRGLAEGAEQPG